MQVARTTLCLHCVVSGERVSNAWVTYLELGNNSGSNPFAKVLLIPDEVTESHGSGDQRWGSQDLPVWERPMSYQLVGEVTAHQGSDG